MSDLKDGYVLKHNGYYYSHGSFSANLIESAYVFTSKVAAERELQKYCSGKFAQNNLVFKIIPVYLY